MESSRCTFAFGRKVELCLEITIWVIFGQIIEFIMSTLFHLLFHQELQDRLERISDILGIMCIIFIIVVFLGLFWFSRSIMEREGKRPEIKFKKFIWNAKNKSTRYLCAICIEESGSCDKKKLVKLDCPHIFHEKCLKRWTSINPVCPSCRTIIK